jgi:hypothetical protein
VEAIHPDDFLLRLLEETPQKLARALEAQSARLKNPPMAVSEIVELLAGIAPKFSEAWHRTLPGAATRPRTQADPGNR